MPNKFPVDLQDTFQIFTLSELDSYHTYNDLTSHTISKAYMKCEIYVNAMQKLRPHAQAQIFYRYFFY